MDQQSSINDNASKNIHINFDDFNINEDSFKPVTKGLGFHHEQKRVNSFKSTPKEVVSSKKIKSPQSLLNDLSKNNKEVTSNSVPSGLEAFYSTKPSVINETEIPIIKNIEEKISEDDKVFLKASAAAQFFAWIIDLSLVLSFSAITTILLILVSGLTFNEFLKVIPIIDLATFGGVLFTIYYLLYFTILDLSATPGKTILGIRLVRMDNKNVGVKNTFTRALVSLLSSVAIFLPNLIDFQGKLSDTKVIK